MTLIKLLNIGMMRIAHLNYFGKLLLPRQSKDIS